MHVDTPTTENDTPLGSRAQASGRRPKGRIVVGVDGSDRSVDALRWATGQSELTGATVDAVTGWDYPTQAIMSPGIVGMDWAANAQVSMDTALHQAFGEDHANVFSPVRSRSCPTTSRADRRMGSQSSRRRSPELRV